MLTYHPVFVRRPLPRDLRGFLPLPATPLVADNIEHAKMHGHKNFQELDPQLSDRSYNYAISECLQGWGAGRVAETPNSSSTRGKELP